METVFIVSWVVLATIFMGMLIILISFMSKNARTLHRLASFWGKFILLISGIRVKVKGLSNIDPNRSYIYMPNHQSYFDIPVLLGCLEVQFRWLAKVELFSIPIFGRAMQVAGYISIDRSDRKSAFRSLSKAAQTIRSGVSVVIFPEGTRTKDGTIGPFKKGGFVLAIDSIAPIVPVVIHGTREIMSRDRLTITPRDVVLEIRPPIETAGYTRKTKDELMEKVRQSICKSFDRGER